jgi:Tfp pilus assembly protein PilN
MIELNILKTRLEKFRRQRVVLNLFIIYFTVLVFFLGLLAMNFIVNKLTIKRIRNDIKTLECKITDEKEKVGYIKNKEQESEHLLKNLEIFSSEVEKRIIWAPILHFTGQNVPSGIWLERFSVKNPATQKKSEKDKAVITISGYVFPEIVNEREAIDRFVRNMSRGDIFREVYLKEVKKEMKGVTEVRAFNIECGLQ